MNGVLPGARVSFERRRRVARGVGRRGQVDFGEQLTRDRDGDAAALGQLPGYLLDAAPEHACESAHGALGDRDVRQTVDIEVQHTLGLIALAAMQRADQRERSHVDPNHDSFALNLASTPAQTTINPLGLVGGWANSVG